MFRRIVKNLTYVSTARMVASVIVFLANIIFARYLGSTQYGIYTTVITYVAFFSLLMDMGLTTLLLRAGGEDKKSLNSRLVETFILKLFLSAFAFILMYIIAGFLKYSIQIKQFSIIIFVSYMFISFSVILRRVFYIYEDLIKEAIFVIASPIIRACIILILVYQNRPLSLFFWFFMLESLLMAAIISITVSKKYKLKFKVGTKPKGWIVSLWQALPFAGIALFGRLHKKIDIIMLSKMRNISEVGVYGLAYRFVDATLFLPAILSSVLLPVLSGSSARGEMKEFIEVSNKMLGLSIVLVLPFSLILSLFSTNFIPFLYGQEFLPSSKFLSILSFTFIFMFPNAIMGTVLYALKKQNITLYNTLACFVFNALTNSIFIPRFGGYGAAITAVLTQILMFVLNFFFISKVLYKIPYISLFKAPVISGLLMSVFVYFTKEYVWLSLTGAIFIYFILSLSLGSIKIKDIRNFLKLFTWLIY